MSRTPRCLLSGASLIEVGYKWRLSELFCPGNYSRTCLLACFQEKGTLKASLACQSSVLKSIFVPSFGKIKLGTQVEFSPSEV